MYRSILVPLDGSPLGEHALPLALSLAQHADATLRLVHVHAPIIPPASLGNIIFDATLDAELCANERTSLERCAQRLSADWDIPVTATVLDGLPIADVLLDYACASDIDLIVMTTHGRGALSRFWLGSVADRLVRRAMMPVVLVRPQERQPDLGHERRIKHMLIPLDGSLVAETILEHAIALGTLMQMDYTLLYAIDPLIVGAIPGPYAVGSEATIQERLRKEAYAYLERSAKRFHAQALPVTTQVVVGQPANAILDYAGDHKIDLIALATHGRSAAARLLLGSVADKVVRGTTIPVLLHHPCEQAEARVVPSLPAAKPIDTMEQASALEESHT